MSLSTRPCLPVSGCVAGTQSTGFRQCDVRRSASSPVSQAAVCTQRRRTTNLPTSAFRSRHAASVWPSLVEGAGESRLQAGRDCLSVPIGTAVSLQQLATCRRTKSAPAAFFNVQPTPLSSHQPVTRLVTVGDRVFPVVDSRLWNSLPTDVMSATTLSVSCSRLKTYLFSVSFPAWLTVSTLTNLSVFAVCINLGHLKYSTCNVM